MELQQLQSFQQDQSATYDDLYEALGLLRQDYQTVILLHYFYDFKLQEIATMTGKPLNTVKIQLHRARNQLKKQLEVTPTFQTKQQDVNTMLKQQLKEAALKFFTIPSHYELCIDDVENAMFLWKDAASDEGYYVEFDKHGKLLSLSQPATETDVRISIEEQERIAKQFLTSQYAEALDYYTLSKVTENEDRTRFGFEQFVGGIPLASYYCFIEVASNGQILDFNFKGYTKNPPSFPETLLPKETVLAKLLEADWTASMSYLSSDYYYYSVPASGLYVLYESRVVYSKFDASTGVDALASKRENDEEIEHEVFVPIPTVEPHIPKETIEDIVGVTPSMEIVRQAEIDQDKQGIVWREKDWQTPHDKSMNSFIQDRVEHTVKATIKPSTNELKGFVWFKKRTGDLDLTFEECRNIAVSFIATYYREYIPYLQMKLEEPSFNELHRAFFTFPITVDGYRMDGEVFVISVNKTTGFIDMLMTPDVEVSTIQAYTPAPLLELSKMKQALNEIDAVLQWASNYDGDVKTEQLNYTFAHHKTKQKVKGINAITGELILMDF